jgi:hypothetical protein
MRQPSGGFNNTALSQVFSRTVARYSATTSGPSTPMSNGDHNLVSTAPPTPSSGTSSQPTSRVGPAVGGAVGGVGLLGITAATISFCLWRRRKRHNFGSGCWEKSELSGDGQIPRGQQQHHELADEQLEPRYELDGDFHGVEAHSEEPMVRR